MSVREAIDGFFKDSGTPILFAGAGVAAKAGLPMWRQYLEEVADLVLPHQPLAAQLMRKYIKEGHLPEAVSLLLSSPDIRDGDKYDFLSSPLENYDSTELKPLVRLPFQALVTTNFEKSLHDAYAAVHGKAALEFNLDDQGSLSAASFETAPFIARIHGRLELPKTMILADSHFRELLNRDSYITFLEHVFTRRQILFVGFSFLDPAIRQVLRVVDRKFGSGHHGRHLALLPSDAGDDFIAALERLNIRKVFYDSANRHTDLWDGIGSAKPASEAIRKQKKVSDDPLSHAKKYLAACYVRARLKGGTTPLRIAVVEGIVSSLIQQSGENGTTVAEVVNTISNDLKIPERDVQQYVNAAVNTLTKEGLSQGKDGTRFRWTGGSQEDGLKSAINLLVNEAVNRFVVREGGSDSPEIRHVLGEFFTQVTIQRGWDLGAAFAAGRLVEDLEIDGLLTQLAHGLSSRVIKGLIASCQNLFTHPNGPSADALSTLGRASFVLELVLQAPRDALFHSITLPEKIYLDANILLPAFTPGHPFHAVYKTSIDRLVGAAKQASTPVEILVYEGFLNEVVSHRRLARDEVDRMGIDEAVGMALYYGGSSVNVFIGAYARLVQSQKELTFENFLKDVAPYTSETELEQWLKRQGVNVAREGGSAGKDTIFGSVYHLMEILFADQLERQQRTPKTLRHDAIQLSMLDRDLTRDVRAVLVSADRRVREGIRLTRFAYLGNAVVNSVGLAQMIDLMVGNPAEAGSMTRLLWGTRVSSATEAVKSYFIDRALEQYDEAVAMQINDLVEGIAEEAADQAARRGIDLIGDAGTTEGALRFLRTFEDRFYEGMREIIERRRRESG